VNRKRGFFDGIYGINGIFNHEKHEGHEGGFGGAAQHPAILPFLPKM